MEKRYQIFVSSTFRDLVNERQAVLKAILELSHMPAGMELFPASNDAAWRLIQDVIDASDYYVVIIGGRYGSLDSTGIGYTEKEYDYAVGADKPVIPLLHKKPDNLPRNRTDEDQESWARLQKFRGKIENKHTCKYWENPDDLAGKVAIGLTSEMGRRPAIGWVRANQVPSKSTGEEVLRLKERIDELEQDAEERRTRPSEGTDKFAQVNLEMTIAVKHVPTKEVHSGTKGGTTGCGFDTRVNPTHWVSTSEGITCDKNGCKN